MTYKDIFPVAASPSPTDFVLLMS